MILLYLTCARGVTGLCLGYMVHQRRGYIVDVFKKLENKIGQFFKGLPPLPESSRESLVGVWPWIALLFGVVQVVAAWALWNLIQVADRVGMLYGSFYAKYPAAISDTDRFIIYIGIVVLLVDAAILFLAYPELKRRKRRGWSLLLLGVLLNVVYSVVSLFIARRGAGSFIFSLLGSAVGFYLLYQIKDKYNVGKSKRVKRLGS